MPVFHLRLGLVAALLAATAPAAEENTLSILVLGVAQDGGFPQTGCYQPHCMRGWEDPAQRRMASSIAVIDRNEKKTYLFDATPDMREELYELHKAAPSAEYELDGVFLTHAHIGHYVGIMMFGHEAIGASNVPVYAMPRMREFLSSNGPWDQLVRYNNIVLQELHDGTTVDLSSQLRVTPFRVPHREEYSEAVGYRIEGPNKSAVFIPDIDKWQDWGTDIRDVIRSVDYALVDATFFADGELPGRDMSVIKHPFVSESMAFFQDLTDEEKSRVIFIHMNHSNPLLNDDSEERALVEAAGFRTATEGMRLDL